MNHTLWLEFAVDMVLLTTISTFIYFTTKRRNTVPTSGPTYSPAPGTEYVTVRCVGGGGAGSSDSTAIGGGEPLGPSVRTTVLEDQRANAERILAEADRLINAAPKPKKKKSKKKKPKKKK
jgi:hypothetical protein